MVQDDTKFPRVRIRILLGPEAMMGPGKADLMEFIRDTGSVVEAGREMGMSHDRAWTLVDSLNAAFRDPLIKAQRGNHKGAALTREGAEVLAVYRRMEAAMTTVAQDEISDLCSRLAEFSEEDQSDIPPPAAESGDRASA